MVGTRTQTTRLATGAAQSVKLGRELAEIFWGLSQRVLPEKDSRFADPAWQKNPVYRRVAQSYFAFCEAVDAVATSQPDWRKRERDKFLAGILTSAVAPTNTLLGNPSALRRAIETNGESLLQGARNLANDIVNKQSLPAQVKPGQFVDVRIMGSDEHDLFGLVAAD